MSSCALSPTARCPPWRWGGSLVKKVRGACLVKKGSKVEVDLNKANAATLDKLARLIAEHDLSSGRQVRPDAAMDITCTVVYIYLLHGRGRVSILLPLVFLLGLHLPGYGSDSLIPIKSKAKLNGAISLTDLKDDTFRNNGARTPKRYQFKDLSWESKFRLHL